MPPLLFRRLGVFVLGTPLLLLGSTAPGQDPASPKRPEPTARMQSRPQLEPMAEVKLLMQGINLPNWHGLEEQLANAPQDAEAWRLIRGYSLLIAENGNLLMMRPPRRLSEDRWLSAAERLRASARRLALAAERQDYSQCLTRLRDLAASCNQCHREARVSVEIAPFKNQAQDPTLVPQPPAAPAAPKIPPPPRVPRPPAIPRGSGQ